MYSVTLFCKKAVLRYCEDQRIGPVLGIEVAVGSVVLKVLRVLVILSMEEILHHLGSLIYDKSWELWTQGGCKIFSMYCRVFGSGASSLKCCILLGRA